MSDLISASTRSPSVETVEGPDPTSELIARAIERDIFSGRLRPGEKLREQELAERFGASRHHIREALGRLARVAIVVKERNRGASVRRFTRDEVRQIYEVREILQRQAALRIRLPAEPEAIERLAHINEEYERAVDFGDFQKIHRRMTGSTRNCSGCATTLSSCR
jgi:DNA-binding GntR family transcriptional regulator